MKELKAEDFGLDPKTMKELKDIDPTINLGAMTPEMPALRVRILSEKPESVNYVDKDTKEAASALVIKVLDLGTQTKGTIWLSAISLKMEIFKIYDHHKKLDGLVVDIKARLYQHKKYGETRAYTVAEVQTTDKK